MLVTFTCDAYENITLFGEVALRLLKMMGHGGSVPGAMVANEVPAALEKLQQAIADEKKRQTPPVKTTEEDDDEPEVSLAHRALPLLALLQAAVKQPCDVMWQ